jgi:hypothetical protein
MTIRGSILDDYYTQPLLQPEDEFLIPFPWEGYLREHYRHRAPIVRNWRLTRAGAAHVGVVAGDRHQGAEGASDHNDGRCPKDREEV